MLKLVAGIGGGESPVDGCRSLISFGYLSKIAGPGTSSSRPISDSYATGSVTGSVSGDGGLGGLVGYITRGSITTSYATGSVTGSVSGDGGLGGLVGYITRGSITNSYATGSVEGAGSVGVGGLVGSNSGTISDSYAIGMVSGTDPVGGLVGSNSGTISSSFWDTQTSGQPTGSGVGSGDSAGLLGRTTAQLQAPTGYTGIYRNWGDVDWWDFGTSSQYPVLKVDFDEDGTATWQEFGSQRGDSPALTGVPGAPTGLTATASGQTQIDLAWSVPASAGVSAITGYRIEVSDSGSTWSDLEADTGSTTTSYSHTGLTAETTQHYRVSAINAAGTGPASNVASGTSDPPEVPGAPTGLTAAVSESEAKVDLSWTAPANTGGAPITGYQIESSVDGNAPWTVVDTTGDVAGYTDEGDDNNGPMFEVGTTRYYRVLAINSVGTGEPSNVDKAEDLVARYDANDNGMVDRGEVITAIREYLGGMGGITRSEVIRLIRLYLTG